MKIKTILGVFALCFSTAACITLSDFQAPFFASGDENVSENVVYVNGSIQTSGDGSSADEAVRTFEEGYELLENGGTIVLCGAISTTVPSSTKEYFMPEKSVVITGSYGNTDYDPVWTIDSDGNAKANVQFTATTELRELTINRGSILTTNERCVELWSGPSLTIGDGVNFTNNGSALSAGTKNGQIAVRLGHLSEVLSSAAYTQKSGSVSFIQGGNNKTAVTASSITLSGEAKVLDMLQCGGTNCNVGSSVVNISGNVEIGDMYVNGYGSATLGSSEIKILGGTVQTLTATRIDATVTGKIEGDVSITIGNTAKIHDLSVNEQYISIGGTKSLTCTATTEKITLSNGFGDWDIVTVSDGSVVYVTGAYTAPAASLTVKNNGSLILNSCFNATLPEWNGDGSVTREHMTEDNGTLIGSGDKYSVNVLMSLADNDSLQGTAVYDDYLFVANKLGKCYVYSVSQSKCLGNFWFASGTPNEANTAYINHCNQMMFGPKKFNENDPFPLIYITTGNSGDHDTDGSYISKCAVERISYNSSSNTWSSQLVQTIQFNDSANIPDSNKDGDLKQMYDAKNKKFYYTSGNGYDASAGYEKVGWGWAASFVDADPTEATKDKFFLFCPRFRTTVAYETINQERYAIIDYYTDNNYIITAFNMPALPTSEADFGGTVTLYPKDIIDQFETEYDIYFTQGGTMYQGRIYYAFGQEAAYGEKHANGIRIFDIAEKRIVSRIDLSQDRSASIGTGEKEPECCAFYNGRLVLSAKGDNNSLGHVLYVFDYLEFHVWTEATCLQTGTHYTVCGYCNERVSAVEETKGTHDMTRQATKYATCTQDGIKAHYHCSVCGKNYEDFNGNIELTDVTLPAHKLVKVEAKAPTQTEDGNVEHYFCSKCEKYYADADGITELQWEDVVQPALGTSPDRDSSEQTQTSSENNAPIGSNGCVGMITDVSTGALALTSAGALLFVKKRKRK